MYLSKEQSNFLSGRYGISVGVLLFVLVAFFSVPSSAINVGLGVYYNPSFPTFTVDYVEYTNPNVAIPYNIDPGLLGVGFKFLLGVCDYIEIQSHFAYNPKYPVNGLTDDYPYISTELSTLNGGAGVNGGILVGGFYLYGSTGVEVFRRAWEIEVGKLPVNIGIGGIEPEVDLALYFGSGVRLFNLGPLRVEVNPTYHLIFGNRVDGLIELRIGIVNLFDV